MKRVMSLGMLVIVLASGSASASDEETKSKSESKEFEAKSGSESKEFEYNAGAHVMDFFLGGATLNLHAGEADNFTAANEQLTVGLEKEESFRGVTFGYDEKTFLKDSVGYLVKKVHPDSWYAPGKNWFTPFFWDAFMLDLKVGRERVQELQTDAMGTRRFDPKQKDTFEWAFKYELDLGKVGCALFEGKLERKVCL